MDKEFESSLKSIETENTVDLYFYRPIGYWIARLLRNTWVTPNMITILSVFVGAGTGYLFYFDNWKYTLAGIALLLIANILDCADGQLARLSGIKSEIGRILDGLSGDIWFIAIYVGLALRLTHAYGSAWFFLPAVISGLSHLLQANITDYYKTLHLFFESKEKGMEFQSFEQVQTHQQAMKTGIKKVFYVMYEGYTGVQERMTPELQKMLANLKTRFGDNIPDEIRIYFRRQSRTLMKRYIDLLTFNGRTIVMFLIVLTGQVWLYFIYETLVLNIILCVSIRKHEKICQCINKQYLAV